ncbi:MAG: RNA methyltransferase [Chitinophagaceae bacterium]
MRKWTMEELARKSVDAFHQAAKNPIVIVLDNVRSMHNVGSVFRTADSFLLQGIWLCGYTPRPPHRDIQKTALGATETVAWHYTTTTAEAILLLKNEGYEIVCVEQAEGSIPLHEFKPEKGSKIALVFGNEVEGVDADIVAGCNMCIEIPQSGTKHSLNISVAAGIVMWELYKFYI